MKKVFAVILTLVMTLAMGVTAFAAPNNFISSPGGNMSPELIKWEPLSEECTGKITVTPFADRDDIDEASRELIENARDLIVEASDLTKLCNGLKDAASTNGIDADDLAVSDLFDVDYTDCNIHDDHKGFKLWLDSDALNKFVGLMHFDGEEWSFITNTSIDENGYLVFSTDKSGPFAIVLNTDDSGSSSDNPPQTGDDFRWWIYAALMAVSAIALAVIGYKLKKSEE